MKFNVLERTTLFPFYETIKPHAYTIFFIVFIYGEQYRGIFMYCSRLFGGEIIRWSTRFFSSPSFKIVKR